MLRLGQIARTAVAAVRGVPGVTAAALFLRDGVEGTVRCVVVDPPDAAVAPPPDDVDGVVPAAGGRGAVVPAGGFSEISGLIGVALDRPLDEATTLALAEAARGAAEAVSTAIQFDYFFQRARSNFLVSEATKAFVEDFPLLEGEGQGRIPRLLAKAAELIGPFLDLDGVVLSTAAGEGGEAPFRLASGCGEAAAESDSVRRALAGEVVRGAPGAAEPLLALPMRVGDRVVGAAAVWRATPLATHELLTLHTIVSQAGISASNAILLAELERRAITDGLTRLWNHRHFQERLRHEVARAMRYNQPLALLMIDIDDFKRVNDGYGHPVGDRFLEEVARLLQRCLRETDLIARYGGEEFAALLPTTDSEGAAVVCGRMLDAVRRYAFSAGESVVPVTVSIGSACLPEDGRDAPALVGRADRALYAAKAAGKDRAVAARTIDATA